ncbi:hypothetical protein AeNC1_003694 [Aphanomyces euteiches]|nr:hypothetical protein AeNC1_003694 [Aphanomyces euteiches]
MGETVLAVTLVKTPIATKAQVDNSTHYIVATTTATAVEIDASALPMEADVGTGDVGFTVVLVVVVVGGVVIVLLWHYWPDAIQIKRLSVDFSLEQQLLWHCTLALHVSPSSAKRIVELLGCVAFIVEFVFKPMSPVHLAPPGVHLNLPSDVEYSLEQQLLAHSAFTSQKSHSGFVPLVVLVLFDGATVVVAAAAWMAVSLPVHFVDPGVHLYLPSDVEYSIEQQLLAQSELRTHNSHSPPRPWTTTEKPNHTNDLTSMWKIAN